jgi:hypothetical protein
MEEIARIHFSSRNFVFVTLDANSSCQQFLLGRSNSNLIAGDRVTGLAEFSPIGLFVFFGQFFEN